MGHLTCGAHHEAATHLLLNRVTEARVADVTITDVNATEAYLVDTNGVIRCAAGVIYARELSSFDALKDVE